MSNNHKKSSTISALGVGFLAFIAKAHGAKQYSDAKKAVAQAVLATLITGTVFTILTLGLSGIIPVWMQIGRASCRERV